VKGDIPLSTGRRKGDELNDFFRANRWHDDVFFRNNEEINFDTIGVMDPFSVLRDEVIQVTDPWQSTQGLITNISEADRTAFDSIGYDVVGPVPGAWQGIRIEELAYDGNIAVVPESESTESESGATNGSPANAEFVGTLAPNLRSGDENRRLAFEIHGLVRSPSDVDVYSFRATGGTSVWLDIDQSSPALDSVVELINSDGSVLARSNNSIAEAADPSLLIGGLPFTEIDRYTTNEFDAGMGVVLPGQSNVEGTYLVRVRSAGSNINDVTTGLTQGRYELQIRLTEHDEVPGTTVQFADIRFAATGVKSLVPHPIRRCRERGWRMKASTIRLTKPWCWP
jgi:hypothetical protein